MTDTDWSKQLFDDLVDAGVSLFAYVPDAGNKRLIEHAAERNDTTAVLLTTEEEGVALCAGADLVGKKAVVCMQSSGVGNIPNFLSFVKGGNFPILLVVTVPARIIANGLSDWHYPVIGLVSSSIGLIVSRMLFKWSLRSYRSSGS